MVPRAVIEAKVTDTLKKCVALDKYWQRPLTGEQLQAEMERMAMNTKDPAMLEELFAALDHDPSLIAECLARPILADNSIHETFYNDANIHREAWSIADNILAQFTPDTLALSLNGQYGRVCYNSSKGMGPAIPDDNSQGGTGLVPADAHTLNQFRTRFPDKNRLRLLEIPEAFIISSICESTPDELDIQSVSIPKKDFDSW